MRLSKVVVAKVVLFIDSEATLPFRRVPTYRCNLLKATQNTLGHVHSRSPGLLTCKARAYTRVRRPVLQSIYCRVRDTRGAPRTTIRQMCKMRAITGRRPENNKTHGRAHHRSLLGAGDCWGLVMTRCTATGRPGFYRSALRVAAIVARAIYPPPGTHWRALRDLRANSIAHVHVWSEPRLM